MATASKKTTKKVAAKPAAMPTPVNRPAIFQAINNIMRKCDGLTKDRRSDGGFNYRGIDDMYNYLHDLFVDEGVFSVPEVKGMAREERKSSRGKTLVYTLLTVEYTFYATDGSYVKSTVVGEAFDTGDKSASKALAIAHKYALFQITMLPTMISDPDAEVHQLGDVTPAPPPTPPAPPPPKMATREQWKILNDYRKIGAMTGEQESYIDDRGDHLTHKQASQMIALLDQPETQEGT